MNTKTRFTLPSSSATNDILVSENIEQTLSNKKFKDNNNNEYTIDNLAKLNISNIFNGTQTINVSTTTDWHRALVIRDNTMTSGNGLDIPFGKSDSAKNEGEICYHHVDDGSDSNNITIGFHSVFNQTLTADGTTKFIKLDSTQTTANNAFGENLKHAIFDLIYPIGSIYVTMNEQTSETVSVVDDKVRMTLYGCTFELLPSEKFIKNIKWLISNTGKFVPIEDSGKIAGEATHTHNNTVSISNASHTLTVNEIPSHQHLCAHINSDIHGGEAFSWPVHMSERLGDNQNYNTPTQNTGGGQGHKHNNTVSITNASASNIPPYITMYMWKRVS